MSVTLPLDILTAIVLRTTTDDLDAFTLVCTEWRAAAVHAMPLVMDRFKVMRLPDYHMVVQDTSRIITIMIRSGKHVPVLGDNRLGWARKMIMARR